MTGLAGAGGGDGVDCGGRCSDRGARGSRHRLPAGQGHQYGGGQGDHILIGCSRVGSPARCAATIAWTAAPASARWAEAYAFGFHRAYAIDLRLRVPTRWRPFIRRDAVSEQMLTSCWRAKYIQCHLPARRTRTAWSPRTAGTRRSPGPLASPRVERRGRAGRRPGHEVGRPLRQRLHRRRCRGRTAQGGQALAAAFNESPTL
jgi:hypothetical protein